MNRHKLPTAKPTVKRAFTFQSGHCFLICYREQYTKQALRQLGRWAYDARVPFTWYDAAEMSRQIRSNIPEDRCSNCAAEADTLYVVHGLVLCGACRAKMKG